MAALSTLHLALLLSVSLVQASQALSQLSATYLRAYEYFLVDHTRGRQCQSFVRSEAENYCRGFGYNMTMMPNLLNHQNQSDALRQMKGLDSLVQANCSWELPFLLCSLYFPICAEVPPQSALPSTQHESENRPRQEEVHMTTPCRSLCNRVKDQCMPVLSRFHYPWPEDLNCSLLQEQPTAIGPNGETIICFPQPPNTFQPTFEREVGCSRQTCASPAIKKKLFKKSQYHFAIQARLIDSGLTNGRKHLHVHITQVLSKCKQNVIPRSIARQLRPGEDALLTTNARNLCDCPQLNKQNEYILTGWVTQDTLTVHNVRSVIRPTNNKLRKKVKKWARRNCAA
ncbi:secreted frizzled-related protein 3-like [Sycon ciliatum]|uniref:secreted frizzled-related protein 3-like n=1 Tax=Sycon ciliatum TaxID=27933 RepID=UPI0020AD0142|eukprot:scpid62366/ scgid7750/ Secreted frizzled-related protein 3; Frizzled-related protein 1; FrzB-1